MAITRSTVEDWSHVTPTTITTRPSPRQPRDERVRIPQCAKRNRPAPIHVAATTPGLNLQSSKVVRADKDGLSIPPRDPEIVDLAAPSTWPRREVPLHKPGSHRMASPTTSSRCSARQSEMSFGILDYYIRDVSPLNSPELSAPTPKLDYQDRWVSPLESPTLSPPKPDPAIEQFDFGLQDTNAGAPEGPPVPAKPSQPQHKKGYSLFPTVHESNRPTKPIVAAPQQKEAVPTSTIRVVPSHSHPDPSYRPRKESLTSSVRSRKDSFTSFRSNRQIPLRILSASSTTSGKTHSSGSISASSPPERSRWSDETIKSPTAATTPNPRTSFGSIMGRDSVQYPACFFEDDDERVPLRSKFAWKRSISLTTQERPVNKGKGRFDERRSFGKRVARVLLCASCCA